MTEREREQKKKIISSFICHISIVETDYLIGVSKLESTEQPASRHI